MQNIRDCFLITIILFALIPSCKSQSFTEKIKSTTQDIVTSIENDDFQSFTSFVQDFVYQKDISFLRSRFEVMKTLFQEYNIHRNATYKITNLVNPLGQRLVIVPIHIAKSDTEDLREAHLSLYFGPPQINSLDKISGFKIVMKKKDSQPWNEEDPDFKPYRFN